MSYKVFREPSASNKSLIGPGLAFPRGVFNHVLWFSVAFIQKKQPPLPNKGMYLMQALLFLYWSFCSYPHFRITILQS